MFNRYRLDRPLGALVATYVHEAAHKGGYSHRPGQTRDRKCEPPYVMAQIARKLAEPDKWASFAASKKRLPLLAPGGLNGRRRVRVLGRAGAVKGIA
jgi:hypothetical protein